MGDPAAAVCLELLSFESFLRRLTLADHTSCKGAINGSTLVAVTWSSNRTVEARENLRSACGNAFGELCNGGQVDSNLCSHLRERKDGSKGQGKEGRSHDEIVLTSRE